MPVVTTYMKFAITKNFGVASFFPEVRSVQASNKPGPNVVVQDLALTSPVSWTINEEQLKSDNAKFNEKTGAKGPLSVMAVSTYTPPEARATGSKNTSQTGSKPEETEKSSRTRNLTRKQRKPA